MPSTQFDNNSSRWDLNSLHPEWVWDAASRGNPTHEGNFSKVFEVSETEVVKFVSEKGALDYLKRCAGKFSGINFLPTVSKIASAPVIDRETGQIFFAVKMARLHPLNDQFKGYCTRFAQLEAEFSKDPALSVRDVSRSSLLELAKEVRAFNPALSLTLGLLARDAWNQHWFVDLGFEDNWMVDANGQLTLSDPVHHVDSFRGYRSTSDFH